MSHLFLTGHQRYVVNVLDGLIRFMDDDDDDDGCFTATFMHLVG